MYGATTRERSEAFGAPHPRVEHRQYASGSGTESRNAAVTQGESVSSGSAGSRWLPRGVRPVGSSCPIDSTAGDPAVCR